MTAPVLGVILAGGAARRLGGADKALVPLAGRPLIAHVAERFGPQCAGLAINAGGDPARFAPFGAPVVPDDDETAGAGPLAGILAGLDFAVAAGFDCIVTAPCDAPFLPPDYVARLIQTAEDRPGAQIVVAESQDGAGDWRGHFVCGLFPVSLRGALRADLARGARKAQVWVRTHGAVGCRFNAPAGGPAPFANLNTPEDLAAAEAFAV